MLKEKIVTIIKSSDNTLRSVSAGLGVKESTAASKISRNGLTRIEDLIKLCNFCDAKIFIETKDGQIIPITIDDL